MGEFELIAAFVRELPHAGPGLALGPGDDGALLRPSPGSELCVTVDTVRLGVHFTKQFTPEDVGHKALAVNLSDLAAMGARPRWLFCALELPRGTRAAFVTRLARGMAPLAQTHGCLLAGGNVSRGPGLAVTITAIGDVPSGLALRRDGLRPGDLIAVTGALGGAALGLRRLRVGDRRGAARQLRPIPRIELGLAARGLASAAIDVSDGLLQDLGHLCRRSSCGAEVSGALAPIDSALAGRVDRLALALGGGEDYELVFGVPPARLARLRRKVERRGSALTVIGRACRGRGVRLAGGEGALAYSSTLGFRHF
ncbi:MAG: thiamine-phosphate kinase [Deltaproteobacteria bacterium]